VAQIFMDRFFAALVYEDELKGAAGDEITNPAGKNYLPGGGFQGRKKNI
jgi:hypothetical protein